MRKRMLAAILMAILALILTGCGPVVVEDSEAVQISMADYFTETSIK